MIFHNSSATKSQREDMNFKPYPLYRIHPMASGVVYINGIKRIILNFLVA